MPTSPVLPAAKLSRPAALLLAAAALVVLRDAGVRIRESGAIPAEEFGPAGLVYGTLPVLVGLGIAFAVAGATLAIRSRGRGSGLLVLGAILVSAAAPLPFLLLPAAAVVALAAVLRQGDDRFAEADPAEVRVVADALARFNPGDMLRVLVVASAAGTVAGAVLGLVEIRVRTAPLSPGLFPGTVLAEATRGILAWAGISGLMAGAFATAAGLAHLALTRAVRRWSREDPGLVLFAATLFSGAGAGLLFLVLARGAIADEIDALGLGGSAAALAIVIGVAAHAHLWGNLVRRGTRGPGGVSIRSPGGFAAALASFALLPPAFLLRRRLTGGIAASRRGHAAAVALVAGAVLLLLGLALTPEVEDYRDTGFSFYAAVALLVLLAAIVSLAALLPRPEKPGRRVIALAALVPAAALLAGAGPARRADVRLVLYEYTRFGAIAADYLPEGPLRPFPRLGAEDPGVGFPFRAPEERTLPPRPPELSDRPARPPILFVVWDAVRPDHLPVYGYPRRTTPVLDRLAAESAVFTRAYAPATATTNSVRCFLSGRYATRYMLTPKHPPFFVRELAAAGYHDFVVTAMGTDYNGVSGESFVRGWEPDAAGAEFEIIDIPSSDDAASDPPKIERVAAALSRRTRGGPGDLDGTFVYLHLIGGHLPWKSEEYGSSPADRYDGEIAKLDRLLGKLFGRLREMGVLDRFVIALLADHGTGLGEHGRLGGFLAYEEQIRVPLIVRVPGLAPRRIDDMVSLIDVAPTLTGLVTPGAPNPYHGRSLMPLLTGERERLRPRPIVSLSAFSDAYALIDGEGRMKLWHHRARGYEALFDLTEDPEERRNLERAEPDRARTLRRLLDAFLWRGRGTFANPWHYAQA